MTKKNRKKAAAAVCYTLAGLSCLALFSGYFPAVSAAGFFAILADKIGA